MMYFHMSKWWLLFMVLVFISTVSAKTSEQPQGAKAGFAEIVITPQTSGMGGYCNVYKSKGVHDDLYAGAAYFEQNDKKALLIGFDLQALRGNQATVLREAIKKACKLDDESIFFTCSHTHAGVREHENYTELLTKKTVQVAKEAMAAAKEFDLGVNFTLVDENVHRPFFFQDGTSVYTPNYKMLLPITTGHTDKQLYALYFFDKKEENLGPYYRQPYAVIVNYTVHPVIAGHTLYVSADFPGVIRKEIRESLDCPMIYITGAAGDNHPKRPEAGFAEVRRVGEKLASEVIQMRLDADFIANKDIVLKYTARTMLAKTMSQEDFDSIPQKIHDETMDWGFPLKSTGQKDFHVGYSLLAVGPVCFFGVPGEWDSELGSAVKWFSPFKRNLIMYNATTPGGGYWMHPNLYKWGGKETYRSPVSPKYIRPLFNKMIDAAEELYHQ